MHRFLPFTQLIVWVVLMAMLIHKKRSGDWKRPHTFKWAMILMTLAIVLAATGAILELYNL
jgi:uncharacterized membrane protein SirB2